MAQSVYTDYTANQTALQGSMEKLATGLKVNRGADDPAALSLSDTLSAQVTGTDASLRVLANASNFINTADGYLQSVDNILGRMSDLCVGMGDATLTTGEWSDMATEFNGLQNEILNIQANATFNNTPIFGSARTFTVDANGSQFTIGTDALASLANVAYAPETIEYSDDPGENIVFLQTARDMVSSQRAALGAAENDLTFQSSALQTYSTNASAAESRIRDTDIAQESANFARDQILVQSSTAMLAQANAAPQGLLKLLSG